MLPRLLARTFGPLLRLRPDRDHGFIDRLGRSHEEAMLAIPAESWDRLIRSLGLMQCRNILDVGCGSGAWLPALAKLNGHVVGVDPDARALDTARAHAAGIDNIQVLQMAAEALEFEPSSFDAVTCLTVLPYVDQASALRQIAGVLVPHGKLVIGTVGPGYYAKHVVEGIRHDRVDVVQYGLDPLLVAAGRAITSSKLAPGSIQAWSARAVRGLVSSERFSVETVLADVTPVDSRWPTRFAGGAVYFVVVASKRAQDCPGFESAG